jgi:uncharacterized protein YndB with AHSA1/START domain
MSETTRNATSTASDSATSLRITRRIRATPEELFDAWTNPESIRVWMCPGDVSEARAKLDPRVGGKFQIDMVGPTATFEHTGEYLIVDRPRKLSFTWVSIPTNNQRTVVTIELKPISKDETELTLTHVGFPSAEAAKNHEMGWGMILDKLAIQIR